MKERVSRKLLENQLKQLAEKMNIFYIPERGAEKPDGGVYLSYWRDGGGYQLEFVSGKGSDSLRYPGRRNAATMSDLLEFANNLFSLYLQKNPRPRWSVTGRRWFDRAAGNTYHTVEIVDMMTGETIYKSPMQYGYDDQYKTTAFKWLVSQGYYQEDEYRRFAFAPSTGEGNIFRVYDVKKREL